MPRLSIIAFLSTCLASYSALAASVVNLDDEVHKVTFEYLDSTETLELKPNEVISVDTHPVKVKTESSHPVRLDKFADYAIWDGGVITRQHYRPGVGVR